MCGLGTGTKRRYGKVRCAARDIRGQHSARVGAAVGVDVLYGLVGIAQMERAVIVMMVAFLLHVEHSMRNTFAVVAQ